MLNMLRRSAGTWVVRGFLLLIVLSFAIWGVGDMFRVDLTEETAIEVGDTEISAATLRDSYRQEIDRLRQRTQLTPQQIQMFAPALMEGVVGRLVDEALYRQEGDSLGLAVSNEAIAAAIRANKAFAGEDGRFDPDRYAAFLRQSRMSEPQLLALMRTQTLQDFILGAVAGGAEAPLPIAAALRSFRDERRRFEVVAFPAGDMQSVPAPDDAALQAFLKENEKRFARPETRAVTVVSITPERLADEIAVSDDELRQAYDDHRGQFVTPATRTLRQILVSDEETAKRAYERLREGAAFEAVARDVAGQAPETLSLGEMTRADLPGELADPAFSTPVGQVTAPIHTPLGWHILQVQAEQPETARPFEAVRDDLRREIALDRARDLVFETSNQLEDALAGGATLSEAASRLGLPAREVPSLAADGTDGHGKKVDGAPDGGVLADAAFDTAEGSLSGLRETRDGASFILRVDGVTAPEAPPLDAIRESVAAAWRAAEARKVARASAETLLEAARAAGTLRPAAEAAGRQVTETAMVTRGGGGDVDVAVRDAGFALAEGGMELVEIPDGYAVIRVAAIEAQPADAASVKDDPIVEELAGQIAGDMRQGLEQGLRASYGVEVDEQMVRSIMPTEGQ